MRASRLAAAAAVLLCVTTPAILAAQSSMFGVRGLGLPGRPLTAQSRALGGSFALFDGESNVNPAALATVAAVSAGFVLAPSWRHWETPAGTRSLRETRFPLMYIGGPIPGSRVGLGISIGSYSDRDFKLASRGLDTLRGAELEVFDTVTSLGGLNEIRLAGGVQVGARTSLGAGVHFITGSSRVDARRAFSDTTYLPIRQKAELSYSGLGLSVGITHQLSSSIRLAAMVRSDTRAQVELDSTDIYQVDLPFTFAAAAQVRASRRLLLAFSGSYRTWSGANSDLLAQGSTGASNTIELAAGGELTRNQRRPGNLPLRLGVRYAQLPFPVVTGAEPREFGLSLGTGTRFAQDRAGIDIALEHAWRSESSSYQERALTLIIGLSIRPYGGR